MSVGFAGGAASGRLVRAAVRRRESGARARLLERLFARVFSGLVYPQIWEDPVIDAEGLALKRGDRIAAIASGGCTTALVAAAGSLAAEGSHAASAVASIAPSTRPARGSCRTIALRMLDAAARGPRSARAATSGGTSTNSV